MAEQETQCEFEFALNVRCQLVADHDQPYYPYLDRGQSGECSEILSRGTPHQVYAAAPPLPPREEWTGQERKDSVSTWPKFYVRDATGNQS